MLDVLVTAVLRLSHAALGAMSERGHGGIINVSSVAAFLPRGTYAAAKAWVNSFSEWAAPRVPPRGVQVMALCPGFTKTEFHERMGVSRGSAPALLWLDADDLVATALADFDQGPGRLGPRARSYKAITRGWRSWSRRGPAAAAVAWAQVALGPGTTGRRPVRPERAAATAARSSRRSYSAGVRGVAAQLVVGLAECRGGRWSR